MQASCSRPVSAPRSSRNDAYSAWPLRFSPAHPNVLIIFLDRFMGSYVESILETDPELVDRLSGFTWYPRTVAAGQNSIAGVHPMLGGYDYTPVEMYARGRPLSASVAPRVSHVGRACRQSSAGSLRRARRMRRRAAPACRACTARLAR